MPSKPRSDIDAVAHQVAVAFLDHVAEMDADPKFDALVRRDPSVALDHRPLDFNGAVHCVDDTPELDNCAIAGALDDPAVVHGDGRIDQVASERPQPRENPVLVGSGKPRIADHVGHQDRGQFSGLAHGATPPRPCQPFRVVPAKPLRGIAKTREECRCLWAWSWRSRFRASVRGKRGKPGPRSPTCRELTYPAPRGSLVLSASGGKRTSDLLGNACRERPRSAISPSSPSPSGRT